MGNKFDDLAATIDDAARKGGAIQQLSVASTFTLSEAYDIQEKSIGLRLARGEYRVGMKMGFTRCRPLV